MTTLNMLRAAVEKAPGDWQLRAVYADALEEEGETTLANGMRYQGIEEKYPSYWSSMERWGWYEVGVNTFDDLPSDVWQAMEGGVESYASDKWKWFPSLLAAETSLAHALAKLGIIGGVQANG